MQHNSRIENKTQDNGQKQVFMSEEEERMEVPIPLA